MCYLLLFPHHTQEIFAFFRGTLQRNWGQSICQVCLSSMMSIQVSKTEIILSTKVFSSFYMSQQCAYCLPCLLLKCLTCIYWMPSWCNYIRLWQGSHKLLISSLPGQDIHLSKSDPFRWHVRDKVNEEIWNIFSLFFWNVYHWLAIALSTLYTLSGTWKSRDSYPQFRIERPPMSYMSICSLAPQANSDMSEWFQCSFTVYLDLNTFGRPFFCLTQYTRTQPMCDTEKHPQNRSHYFESGWGWLERRGGVEGEGSCQATRGKVAKYINSKAHHDLYLEKEGLNIAFVLSKTNFTAW